MMGWEQRKKFVPVLSFIVSMSPASVSPGEVIVAPVGKD
jgi:hypothetical protein